MKVNDQVELVIDSAGFKKFPWSGQVLDPAVSLPANAPAFGVTGEIMDFEQPHGVVLRTVHTWDASRRAQAGVEVFVPWPYVIAILEATDDRETNERRAGFLSQGAKTRREVKPGLPRRRHRGRSFNSGA